MLNAISKNGVKMCRHRRYKIVHTHGEKSNGYLVCKDCHKLLNKKEIKKDGRIRRKKDF
jgi:hypothetical protein